MSPPLHGWNIADTAKTLSNQSINQSSLVLGTDQTKYIVMMTNEEST